MTVVTAICFALLTAELLYFAISIAVKDRAGRIAFLRGFKKGKCIVVYFSAIPLFCIGHLYAGQDFFEAFFGAVNQIVNLVVLKYSTSTVQALMSASLFYKITMYYCFTLVGLNAIFFTLSLLGQRLFLALRRIGMSLTGKELLCFFGCNRHAVSLCKSDKARYRCIYGNIPPEEGLALYAEKLGYISCSSFGGPVKQLFRIFLRKKKRGLIAVIDTGSEETNLKLCRLFTEQIGEHCKQDPDLFKRLRVFVFGDPAHEAVYEAFVREAKGCLHYVDAYKKAAMSFIDKYPFTQFMDGRQIDYETSLIRSGVEINVCMLGFGKANRQIFLTSVANNQFLTAGEHGPVLKQVNYHIFDKNVAENNKILNHSYYRFRDECEGENKEKYLPLPAFPAREEYHHLDLNDNGFYRTLRTILTAGENDVNFIVIAYGSDLENIDMARRLLEKRREWGAERLTVFVRSRSMKKRDAGIAEDCCHFIGAEEEIYDVEELLGDAIYRMAKLRNEIYDLEYTITHSDVEVNEALVAANREASERNWYLTKSLQERESSLYCCLSLRSKLQLMGLDYVPADAVGEALTREQYFAVYAKDDLPDTQTYAKSVCGKPVVSYTLDFKHSRRENLAILEHYRWNSFMISKGTIPATREEILNETAERGGKLRHTNGKNYALRRHGNLTTFEGLVLFREMVAARDGSDPAEADVIKYDYQLLDDAHWLLTECGFKIVKKP